MDPFSQAVQHLPRQAGEAVIRWSSAEGPVRKGPEIVLPLLEGISFIPLQDGQQFLYVYGPKAVNYARVSGCWFGGTDENPFLVRLNDGDYLRQSIRAIEKEGESVFYEALRPEDLGGLEKFTQTTAKRQGDIFALPISPSWSSLQKEMERCSAMFGAQIVVVKSEKKVECPVFGTRHILKGTCAEVRADSIVRTFATGALEAPDHSPLGLDNVHALFQSAGLYRPEQAD